jgi:diguanylate cyclase (GGDEF)-like protein/PAS domain S-box-containing protein
MAPLIISRRSAPATSRQEALAKTPRIDASLAARGGSDRFNFDGGRTPDSRRDGKAPAISQEVTTEHSIGEDAASTFWTVMNDGIVIMDQRLRILDVNPAFRKMSGFTSDELVGRTPRLFKVVNGDASAFRDMTRRLKRDGCWLGRSWNRRKDGSIFITEEHIQSLRGRADEVTGYVTVFTDVTENVERERNLLDIVCFDPLTGLLNRNHLRESVVKDIAKAHLTATKLAIFYIDLDRFKAVNDRLGHSAGNELLLLVSQRLRALAGPQDHVARAGGDAFIIVLSSLLDESQVEDHAERVQAAIRGTYVLESNKTVYVSASIGIALYPQGGTDPEQLLRQADRAMYTAKDQGRDRYVVFDVKGSQQVDEERRRVQRITHALEHEELILYYQPKINLRTGALAGAEALLRWNHPEEGIIYPDQFLPLVAGTPEGAAIDRWVIGEALRNIEKHRTAGRDLQIAVNIDGAYLQQPEFVEQLSAQLDQHPNLPRHLLELEILESIALTDLQTIGLVIDQLHRLGVHVALDDFGTGYSSLTYLQKLPTDTLKIDKLFIIDMFEDKYSQTLVQSIIDLAMNFERKVIAEGVETERHVAALAAMGCEHGQGYFIARPMPADEFSSWISAREENPAVPTSSGKVVRLGQ